MEWLSFLVGALVGWVVEWLIDFFYWRRKWVSDAGAEAQLRNELAAAQEELEALRAQLSAQEQRISTLGQAVAAPAVDDLTMIEGVGPKTVELLNQHDIYTFAQLAEADVGDLRAILEEGGSGFRMADPTSWPRQARLAANRDWVRLAALKQELTGGVRRPAQVEVPSDDLTMIEGVGPKTAELLNQHGIRTFAQLADTDAEELRAILEEGGSGFRMADPTSWPRQARLAANRDWVRLAALKQELTGGVRRPAQVEEPDDDLTLIEGVGPKTVELLNQHDIRTFAQLGECDGEELRAILEEGGSGFHLADPTSWPRQARFAANRDWVRLAALKQELTGGVRRPSTEEDNLTMIEGIGPQVSALLKENGIRTFAQLSRTDAERLRDILSEAGPQFRLSVPDTWPEQAALAAAGSWEQLQELQNRLAAGRATS
jgi:predicted flap endonuclease-1-like 5' DNA nuclease